MGAFPLTGATRVGEHVIAKKIYISVNLVNEFSAVNEKYTSTFLSKL